MKKYSIVIVDNDEDELFFMKEAFDTTGLFDILAQCESGDELMDWLNNKPFNLPDVILSDLNMHGKNGYDIIQGVKDTAYLAHIPVVITSTSSTQTIIDKCIAKGAAAYLVKPSSFIEYQPFIKKLHQLIEEKQLVR
ncbi:MAG: response regulator [Segetibacter sp.]|nr:response regulator [Segetibacter sp.]